jgi:hypothetical protein
MKVDEWKRFGAGALDHEQLRALLTQLLPATNERLTRPMQEELLQVHRPGRFHGGAGGRGDVRLSRRHTPAERVIGKGKGLPITRTPCLRRIGEAAPDAWLVFCLVDCVLKMIQSMIQTWRVLPPHDCAGSSTERGALGAAWTARVSCCALETLQAGPSTAAKCPAAL